MKIMKNIMLLCVCFLSTILMSCNDADTDTNADSAGVTSSQIVQNDENIESEDEETMKDNTLWERKMVAITVDDGPKECTEKLLDGLRDRGVKVTFFLLGNNIDARPELVRRMVDEGHTIGWHSYDHSISNTSTEEKVEECFRIAQQTLDKHGIDYQFKLFRGPGGHRGETIAKYAKEYDFRIIGWTNGSFNDKLPTAQQMCDSTYDYTVANGSVILIHDYNETVVDGILLLVDRLISEGFEPVNLDEMMKRRNGGEAGACYGTTLLY